MVSQNVETHWKGREGPFSLLLGPGVFSPTTTSRTLADALEITPGDTVIDVGCGSGVLSIVAAKLGAAKVTGSTCPNERWRRRGRTPADSGSTTSASSVLAICSSRCAMCGPTC